jgi:hypothetical protein
MNERIKELLEQAGVKYVTMPKDTVYEKFAELIIRECCIALNPVLRDMISRGQGVDLIKLHFGMNPKEITTAMLDTAIAQCEQELAKKKSGIEEPKGWICPKCGADRTKIACPLGFGATVDGRCPMVVTAQGVQE